jgi:uncharacterized membrane protein HdeD (DUF308 family)
MQAQPHPHPGVAVRAPVLLEALARNWWLVLLRGLVAVLFGLLAFAWPGLTIFVLVLFYGAYALIDGALALYAAITRRDGRGPTWWLVFVGLAGIGAGVATFLWPGLTTLVLLIFIAAWAIVRGAFEIIGAIQLRREIEGEGFLILAGLLSVTFGLLLLARPEAGAVAVAWIIGIYSTLFGAILIALALRLRRHARRLAA